MDSAIKIVDEINDLYQEISDLNNVNENIENILDDIISNVNYAGLDLKSEKKPTKNLGGFRNGKMKKQKNYGSHQIIKKITIERRREEMMKFGADKVS